MVLPLFGSGTLGTLVCFGTCSTVERPEAAPSGGVSSDSAGLLDCLSLGDAIGLTIGVASVVEVVSVEASATGTSVGGVISLPAVVVTTVPSRGLCTTTTASFDSTSPKVNLTA